MINIHKEALPEYYNTSFLSDMETGSFFDLAIDTPEEVLTMIKDKGKSIGLSLVTETWADRITIRCIDKTGSPKEKHCKHVLDILSDGETKERKSFNSINGKDLKNCMDYLEKTGKIVIHSISDGRGRPKKLYKLSE